MKQLRSTLATLALVAAAPFAVAQSMPTVDGMTTIKTPHNAGETITRLEAVVKQRGLNVFARIDHAAGATKVGQTLRPTELLIFGNPQGGTPFMQCAQSVGMDLPLKALAWEDAQGQTWLGVSDPIAIAKRHGAENCPAAANLQKALTAIAEAAVAR